MYGKSDQSNGENMQKVLGWAHFKFYTKGKEAFVWPTCLQQKKQEGRC